jgi:hypothetical protein
MNSETLQLELELLRGQQAKAREEEVFGGLTSAERAAYELRQGRIRELESAMSERSEMTPHFSGVSRHKH